MHHHVDINPGCEQEGVIQKTDNFDVRALRLASPGGCDRRSEFFDLKRVVVCRRAVDGGIERVIAYCGAVNLFGDKEDGLDVVI